MFTKTLLPDTLRAIKLVSEINTIKDSYLAGGTALALQLGHRISVDLDFFTRNTFIENAVTLELSTLSTFQKEGTAEQTIWGTVGETKFSLFHYKYPIIEDFLEFEKLKIASLADISAMKILAIEERGTRRDFIDVYFLAKSFSLEKMLNFYDQKYGNLANHLYSIVRSLSYFEDADQENVMPTMLEKVDWEAVKKFFLSESKKIWKQSGL